MPYNPDTSMFWCDNCKMWQHEQCLVDSIKLDDIKSPKKTKRAVGKDVRIATNDATGEVTAYIRKDPRGRQKSEDMSDIDSENSIAILVKCLKCGAQLK
jgi:hypothetical protein